MTVNIDYGLQKSGWRFPKHNPFYLLSAACMLFGCLMLSNTTTWSPIPLRRLLFLIVTVNFYELLLLALGLFLTRRKIIRDAGMLLILQAVFMLDIIFLNAEVVSTNFNIGVDINLFLFIAALGKLEAIRRITGLRVTTAQTIFCVMQIFFLFALPILANLLDGTPRQFYVIWWMIGLLPIVYGLLMKIFPHTILHSLPSETSRPVHTSLYLALPWLSLILHLGILHYVYNVLWLSPMLTPVMIGLSVVLFRLIPSPFITRHQLRFFSIALPIVGVILSQNNNTILSFSIAAQKVGPLMLSISVTYVLFVYWFAFRYSLWFFSIAGLVALWMFKGPTGRDIVDFIDAMWDWFVDRFLPRSPAGWGFIALVTSFVWLAVGAWMSLRSNHRRVRHVEALPATSENP